MICRCRYPRPIATSASTLDQRLICAQCQRRVHPTPRYPSVTHDPDPLNPPGPQGP